MKKNAVLLVLFLLTCPFVLSYAQDKSVEEIMKERSELLKMSRKALNDKASKVARKEAKRLKKAGWLVAPGALPMDKQLDKSYTMQYEFDESGYPKYMMGEAFSTGENYDGAKMQAVELAKQNMAGQIQTEVTALIESQVATSQLSAQEAATITKTVMSSKNLISQSIGRTITVVELYRELPNKNKEVLVRIAYSGEMAKQAAKNAIRKELQNDADAQSAELDKLLNW